MTSFGRPRRHFRLTDSTNDHARRIAIEGAPSGTVVTAAEQTAGRGRHGRSWAAPAGKALLASAILRPLGPEHGLLPLAVPLAICEAVESLAPLECRVKWPNDVWMGGSKLAGILIEARPPDWAVIGIGLNVAVEPGEFPADLRHPAVSIGHSVSVEEALAALSERLGDWGDAPPARILAAFAERDALRGRRIGWEGAGGEHGSGAGTAGGVDERGNLLVVTDAGERLSLGAGEVALAAVERR
jgi:BirA family transcriptional regulator, biotin operon repressor / biotin---[acetyl-CoA-carboxylase] ligase